MPFAKLVDRIADAITGGPSDPGLALLRDSLPADPREAAILAYRVGHRVGMRDARAMAGRIGGAATSDAKRAAARANGAKGGRPRKADPARGGRN